MNEINFTSVTLKYIAMHETHFKANRFLAVSFCMLRILSGVLIEIINVLILISLRSHKDCVENLLALTAILNFDMMFYAVLTDSDKAVIEGEKQLPFLSFSLSKSELEVVKPTQEADPAEAKEQVDAGFDDQKISDKSKCQIHLHLFRQPKCVQSYLSGIRKPWKETQSQYY